MNWEEFAQAGALLRRAGAWHLGPPIPVEPVLDMLAPKGLEMHYYDPKLAPHGVSAAASGADELLVVDGERSLLFINPDRPLTRMRFSIWHGIGHFSLPGHRELNYLSQGCVMDPMTTRRYERQAHRFAAGANMPPSRFMPDMADLPFGLRSVERLAKRYVASVESAAIHYVTLTYTPCALLRLKLDYDDQGFHQPESPLKVSYHLPSVLILNRIPPGTRISLEDNLFWQCSEHGIYTEGEVSGSLLRLKPEVRLRVECMPLGRTGDVLVLVRLPKSPSEWGRVQEVDDDHIDV